MTQRSRSQSAGVTIGMGSGIGGSLGIVFALLSGIELPLGLIFGAALGVLVGLLLESISSSASWLLNEMPHRQDGSQSTTQARSEVSQMSKAVITRLFIGGLVAAIAGFVIALFAALAAFAGSELIMKGPDVVGIRGTPFAWSMVGLVVVGGLAMIGGAVAGLVSWIGALLNTAQLDDKLWFILLLILGLFSFGLIAMIAYVIAGPDSTTLVRRQPIPATT